MSRFFFNVQHGADASYVDPIGEDFPDRASAWRTATTYVGEAIRDLNGDLEFDVEWRLDVNDEDGQLLYRVSITARRLP